MKSLEVRRATWRSHVDVAEEEMGAALPRTRQSWEQASHLGLHVVQHLAPQQLLRTAAEVLNIVGRCLWHLSALRAHNALCEGGEIVTNKRRLCRRPAVREEEYERPTPRRCHAALAIAPAVARALNAIKLEERRPILWWCDGADALPCE